MMATQAGAADGTVTFSGADIVSLSPTSVNSTGTPVIGDGRVDFSGTGGAKYSTYAGPYLDQSNFNSWIASLSTPGNGISYFNLWLQDGASNQAALWGETIALTNPYSTNIHPFASAGWTAEVYTIGTEWGSAWTGKQLITYWSADPNAYLSAGTTATFGFTADIMGNNGATGPNYQMWVGGNNDSQSYGFQRAITAVVAVPEPETFAMLLAGLGLLGYVGRRRQPKDAAAA